MLRIIPLSARTFIFILAVFLSMLHPSRILAHIPNQSYIFLRVYEEKGIEGRFEINVNEINKIFGLSLDKDLDRADIDPILDNLKSYLLEHSRFVSSSGVHPITFTKAAIFHNNLGDYVQVYFNLGNTNVLPTEMEVTFDVGFESDPTHRGFLIVEYNWLAGVINNEANIALYFEPGDSVDTLSLTNLSLWKGFQTMIKQGIWHIWIGLDHILFLIALILPSVVRRIYPRDRTSEDMPQRRAAKRPVWKPVDKFKPAFLYILKVITFFTIAHTITLSLASLQLVELPSRLVESVIALSIGLAAVHNIWPVLKGKDWLIAFVFGLFHGFGFASVLNDLGLTNEFLSLSLLGFNLGVEIGQVVIIMAIFPILYLIRKSIQYPRLVMALSMLLILISLYWGVERVFDVNLRADDYLKRRLYEGFVYLGLR